MNKTTMNEEDILDYLMTSEFTEGLSDKEAQFLLLKFRQYYRFQVSKYEQLNHKFDTLTKDSTEENKLSIIKVNTLFVELEQLKQKNKIELDRKLTFRERFTGKIKRNE